MGSSSQWCHGNVGVCQRKKSSHFCSARTLAKDSVGISAGSFLQCVTASFYIFHTLCLPLVNLSNECLSLDSRRQLFSQTAPVSPAHPSGPQRICPARPLSASFSSGGPPAPPPATTGQTVSPGHYIILFYPTLVFFV